MKLFVGFHDFGTPVVASEKTWSKLPTIPKKKKKKTEEFLISPDTGGNCCHFPQIC